jgi:hypothetical protein
MGDPKPAFDAKAVQANLITLGYLPKGGDDGTWGGGSRRALVRFKRRAAKSTYRLNQLTGAIADCTEADLFKGTLNDVIDQPTLDEIKKWKDKKWKAPLGRFAIKTIAGGKLREDVADAWTTLVTKVKGLGGTIDAPYGDTKRTPKKTTKAGASSFSFHIAGRAVDIDQNLGGPPNQRYYIAKETDGVGNVWRIYCKTDKQDGTQGKQYKKGDVVCWSFWAKSVYDMPVGYYLDLTGEIENGGKFERIRAQSGWENNTNKSEWWHFQWKPDKQETFSDELELVGHSEKDLKDAGYSEADLDHTPG